MKSAFAHLSEIDKKLFIAKIIHNINYSQNNLILMKALVELWDTYPIREAVFFTQNLINQKSIQNGNAIN